MFREVHLNQNTTEQNELPSQILKLLDLLHQDKTFSGKLNTYPDMTIIKEIISQQPVQYRQLVRVHSCLFTDIITYMQVKYFINLIPKILSTHSIH